jgi:hypothetical protein
MMTFAYRFTGYLFYLTRSFFRLLGQWKVTEISKVYRKPRTLVDIDHYSSVLESGSLEEVVQSVRISASVKIRENTSVMHSDCWFAGHWQWLFVALRHGGNSLTPTKPEEDKHKAARMQESTISQVIVGMLFRLVLKLNIVHSFYGRSANKIRKFVDLNNFLDLLTFRQWGTLRICNFWTNLF